MMPHRITTDPGAGDKVKIQAPGSKTMTVARGAGLPKPPEVHPHRRRSIRPARRAR